MLHQNKLGHLLLASFPGLQISPEPTQKKHLTCHTLLIGSESYLLLLDQKSCQEKNSLAYFTSVSAMKKKCNIDLG
jgi:hypothetical protein